MKQQLIELYGNKCFYCEIELTSSTFTKDHVIPKSKGGTNDISNLVPACKSCNSKKADFILTREEVRELKVSLRNVIRSSSNKSKTIVVAKSTIKRIFSEGYRKRADIKAKRIQVDEEVARKILISLMGK